MYDSDQIAIVSSSRTYSKIMAWIEEEYGIPAARPFLHGPLIGHLKCQLTGAVREECRRAVEEAAYRIFRLAAANLPNDSEDGLYIPASTIRINTGDVGEMRLRSFRSDGWPDVRLRSA